jgi:cytochrome c-type biogenesis protein CcmH
MITFSIAAVLLSALAAVLILQRASGAARRTETDPTLAVYRRQITEMDDLAERGLLADGELKAAKAEAARRLLGVRAEAPAVEAAAPVTVSKTLRLWILAGAVLAPAVAVGLYVWLGSPGMGDQPFAERLKGWSQSAQSDPGQLTAPQMAAVLETLVKSRPNDAEPLTFLARAQAASGQVAAAAESMRKATRLEPNVPQLWSNLGILLLMQGQGEETEPAQAAFRRAVQLDPKDAPARYHLARAQLAAGHVAEGLAAWRALAADLPLGDPQRAQLDQEIDATAKAGRLVAFKAPPAQPEPQPADAGGSGADPNVVAGALTGQASPDQGGPPAAAGGDQKAFINSMVARLEDRLKADPSDVAGWARLIRSYAVLGEPDKMKRALDQAHKQFKNNPTALKQIDEAMSAPQGAE